MNHSHCRQTQHAGKTEQKKSSKTHQTSLLFDLKTDFFQF
ncbi:hypothetical protein Q7C_1349 [Methylophaga frappieri]|uniref:Uncharacterized protein n=1 Tax=Methylophaga frappieri (strain ATCC BAA-2434 / DSM 25690 / JAM7) TaxID=754477 RepID=I1YHV6_METFJ|nr:hypothetical protein Q7C_1349 [Methylophaga frappieri]